MQARVAALVGLIGAVLTAGGCASRQHYPATWPALVAADASCQQFAGLYRVTPSDAPGSPPLTQLLFPASAAQTGEWVKVSFPAPGRLHVEVAGGTEGAASTIALGDRPFDCRKGVMVVKIDGHWVGSGSEFGFAVGRRSGALQLHLADGALIVREQWRTTGVVIALPVTYSRQRWYRFERLPS